MTFVRVTAVRVTALALALGATLAACSENAAAPEEEEQEQQVPEAALDNDSPQAPALSQFLSITGTRSITHTNEISAPTGDAEDFVEFEFPNNSNTAQVVRITLDCTITGQADSAPQAQILEDGQESGMFVACNTGQQTLTVDNTKVQLVRVRFTNATEATHAAYTLAIVGFS